MTENPSISIIVPVLNEEGSLDKFYNETTKSLNEYSNWEIIFIDDGSDDESYNIMRKLADEDNRVSIIQFFKNFGKADALSEGFKKANGGIIITIDADLQDDPAEIPRLVEKIQEGWDVVSGWKKDRKDPISKRLPSKLFNMVTRFLTGIKIHDFNCGLKAYRRKVVKSIDIYGGLHRYIPAIAGQKGFSITEIAVNHRPREFGETKYGGNRLFHGFFDLFTMLFTGKYFDRPLHFFGSIGLVFIFISTISEVYPIYDKIANGIPFQKHFALIVFGAMIFGLGLWFFSIGLLGELLIKASGTSEKKIHSVYSKNQK
jgi:glycosyltransferase involved in cell wall biosynthesis